MCIILCILNRKTNTYFKKKFNVKGIKKRTQKFKLIIFTFLLQVIMKRFFFFFSNPQAHWNEPATLTSGLENIYKSTLFHFPKESLCPPKLVKFLLSLVLLNSTHHSNNEVNNCVINCLVSSSSIHTGIGVPAGKVVPWFLLHVQ